MPEMITLRRWAMTKGLLLKDLAARIGVSRSYLYQLSAQNVRLSGQMRDRICKSMNVLPGELENIGYYRKSDAGVS